MKHAHFANFAFHLTVNMLFRLAAPFAAPVAATFQSPLKRNSRLLGRCSHALKAARIIRAAVSGPMGTLGIGTERPRHCAVRALMCNNKHVRRDAVLSPLFDGVDLVERVCSGTTLAVSNSWQHE